MSDFTPTVTGTGVRARVQRFGGFLAGMVMPNIGAFIAWGLITALFIQTGWINRLVLGGEAVEAGETLEWVAMASTVVGPIIAFVLPLLIGYTGGRMVHGQRGAVVGALGTIGVIVSPLAYGYVETIGDVPPQFLGAMIIGPLTAFFLKLWDRFIDGKVKSGFEMLVDNFSSGIIGGIFALVGLFGLGPVVRVISEGFGNGVAFLVDNQLLPLASLIIEPAKVLFLNNALNQGVLTPLGAQESAIDGQSILFMLESNPGPGLGILLAFLFFGPRAIRQSTPAAIVIHFFGGIHEIYFPYVLMKPQMIAAAIAGGASGITVFMLSGAGLVASPSPGSIIAYMIMTPPGAHIGVLLGILVAAVVSFVVGSALLGFGRKEKQEADAEAALAAAQEQNARNKNKPAQADA